MLLYCDGERAVLQSQHEQEVDRLLQGFQFNFEQSQSLEIKVMPVY